MERTTDEEVKAHLMQTDDEFRRLATTHLEYDRKLSDLETHPHLTEAEQMEEVRLKKLKLRLKDQMMGMIHRYKHHHAV